MLLLATLLGSYLLGAIPMGYLVARWVGGIDIRQHGSGNIGATNVARVLGWKFFPLVFALDFLKGAIPVLVGRWLGRNAPGYYDAALGQDVLAVLAGLLAMVGHMWPIYLGFRGGKGVATSAGVIFVLAPLPALVATAAWGVTLYLTRFVSLSSMTAAVVLCAVQLALYQWQPFGSESLAVTCLCVVGAALVVLRHRANIRRLIKGTEPRVGQTRLAENSENSENNKKPAN